MTKEAFVIKASLDLLVTCAEFAEVVPEAAMERVEDTTAEVGEMLTEAVPSKLREGQVCYSSTGLTEAWSQTNEQYERTHDIVGQIEYGDTYIWPG